MYDQANMVKGTELSKQDQKHVLAAYVHRYTKEHKPAWANKPYKHNSKYPAVGFESDADWLEHTRFLVTKSGRLDRRAHHCESTPTWPDNPELRKEV